MDKGGRANTNKLESPRLNFRAHKSPRQGQGLVWFRGNLNLVLTTVRLGVIEIAIVTNHIILTLIADILKL
jgi:hypothetical protein